MTQHYRQLSETVIELVFLKDHLPKEQIKHAIYYYCSIHKILVCNGEPFIRVPDIDRYVLTPETWHDRNAWVELKQRGNRYFLKRIYNEHRQPPNASIYTLDIEHVEVVVRGKILPLVTYYQQQGFPVTYVQLLETWLRYVLQIDWNVMQQEALHDTLTNELTEYFQFNGFDVVEDYLRETWQTLPCVQHPLTYHYRSGTLTLIFMQPQSWKTP